MTFDVTNMVLLMALLVAGIWTVMTSDLLRSAIGLAVTSVILTLVLFHLGGPLAAVFELSVCAGLITVVFISTISLTKPKTLEVRQAYRLRRMMRFVFLPMLLAIVGWYVSEAHVHLEQKAAPLPASVDVRYALWALRRLDLVGQILIVLAGVFGVVVLFKTRESGQEEEKK